MMVMDKEFDPTRHIVCDYLYMLGIKLNNVTKMGPSCTYRKQSPIIIPTSANRVSANLAFDLVYIKTLIG